MFLNKFAEMIFTLLLAFGGEKYAGNSPYSFEVLDSCGVDKALPLCEIAPQCAVDAWRCAPPRWSDSRGGWVVAESGEQAKARYRKISESIARVSFMHARCRDKYGTVVEDCKPSGWPEGPESLAMAAATTALWESGLREDIMHGHAPMGRGALGEACLVQVMPNQIRRLANWIPKEEQKEYDRLPYGRARGDLEEKWAQQMLGDSPEELDRCFDVGMRALARARRACSGRLGGSWHQKMWAMYGTGNSCTSAHAHKRSSTYHRMASYRPEASNSPRGDETVPEKTAE